MNTAGAMAAGFGWLAALGWFLRRHARSPRGRMERARTMPAECLGDERVVQLAEQIVYAAWRNTP
jgi:hypothetical protein